MKLKAFLLSIAVAVILSACGGIFKKDSDTAGVTYPGNLQGQIFDAKTGAPIGGGDLTVILVQGTANRSPDSLVTDTANALAGEYAFGNIPVETTATGNMFKLVVTKPGYQTFVSEFSFGAPIGDNNNGTGFSNFTPYYTKIGNVYLYPTGSIANPIDINVTDTYGKAVAGVTVQLRQDIASNNTNGNNQSNILPPTNGLLPNLTSAVTDATGKATFASTVLALGASYTPVALAITANGLNLDTTAGTSITVGVAGANVGPQVRQLVMAISTYSALSIVARSNNGTPAPLPTGILNLVFNQAVTLDSTAVWTGALTYVGGALPAASGVATVTGTLTGSSLVLTPTFTTPVDFAHASGVTITYNMTANTAQAYLTTTGQNVTGPGANTFTTLVNGNAVKLNN